MADEEYPVIKTKVGAVKGKKEDSVVGGHYYNFLNIPYAKPPVGPLRFEPPEPVEPWEEVRDCTQSGHIAPQYSAFTHCVPPECNEDCLILNVYVNQLPEQVTTPKAVMVFIHGGGFDLGSSNKELFGPDFFMQHDIVLVTMNYRLGALGFLSLQSCACPGNNGLKDQAEGLRWIQRNISCFGGDPNNVTIFGISAGGASVEYLTLSKTTKGLFHKAIAQSGSGLNSWAHSSNPREIALALAKKLGYEGQDDKSVLEFLRRTKWEDIVTKSHRILDEVEGTKFGEEMLSFPFVPTSEPEENNPTAFITEHPKVLLKKGQYHDIPYIVGCTSAEGILALPFSGELPTWNEDSDFERIVPRYFRERLGSLVSAQLATAIREFFFKDGMSSTELINCLSDPLFVHGVYKTARYLADNTERQNPTYFYVFTYDGPRSLKSFFPNFMKFEGAPHGADTYNFWHGKPMPQFPSLALEQEDIDRIYKYTKLWTHFAQTGEPNVPWTPVSKNKQEFQYLEIGTDLVMKNEFPLDRMAFWDELWKDVEEHNL